MECCDLIVEPERNNLINLENNRVLKNRVESFGKWNLENGVQKIDSRKVETGK
jgi:hypothetical protein